MDELKLSTWINNPSRLMAAALDLMATLTEHISYKERFRIVVEYDPEAMNTTLSVFKKRDESDPWECPATPTLIYPHTKEP